VSENPFQDLRTLSVLAGGEDSHLGFVFSKCSHRLRAYLSELRPRTPAAGIRNGRRQLAGAYVVSIQGRPVSTVEQANLALTAAFDATAAGDHIEFVLAPESQSDAVDFRHPPLHLRLSQLKRIHALRTVSGEGDSAYVSATVAALEDAYADADLFETVFQIRVDELDDAGTYELVHHIRGKATANALSLGSFTRRKLKQLLFGIYGLPRNGNSLMLTRSKKSLVCLVLPRLVPPCCVPIGITSSSRVELVKLACAVMDPSAPLQSFASPKRMPRASISHARVCSLLCLLPSVS
jgi:hypothetical protein